MGPAAAEGEIRAWTPQVGEHVHIGEVGPDQQGDRAESGPPRQSAPGEPGADQRVADRIYASLASSSKGMLPLSAWETGQPSFAASAALANAA